MKQLIKKVAAVGATAVGALAAVPVFAQDLLGDVASNTTLSNRSFVEVLGSIINVVLSVLGVVLLIIVIYAGVLWMTAGGNSDNVDKAKQLIINAVIGLVLILAALAISTFVFNTLTTAVTTG